MLDFGLIGKDGFTDLEPDHGILYRPDSSDDRRTGLRIQGGDLTENFFYVSSFLPPGSLQVNVDANSKRNKILIGERSTLRGHLNISGSDNIFIDVGGGQEQNVMEINFHGNNNLVYLGHGMTSNGTTISAQTDCSVIVGDDVMLSQDVILRSSDMHGIFDTLTGELINSNHGKRRHIIIFPHVLVGQNATILKNVVIGPGSIIGASAVVTKNVPSCSVAAGIPAKETRHNTSWSRHLRPLPSHIEMTNGDLRKYGRTFNEFATPEILDGLR